MSNYRYLSNIEELLDLTEKLVRGPNNIDTLYKKILEGISRKSYYTLYSILQLANDKFCGDAILDLSRSLLENVIGNEFIKLKGRDELAKKFQAFIDVEIKNDMDFLIESGMPPSEEFRISTDQNFEKIKTDFLRRGEVSRSWAKCSVEEMIVELVKSHVINDDDKRVMLQTYNMGNRKNHLSPIDILSYWRQDTREVNLEQSVNTGVLFSIISHYKIVSDFATELGEKELCTQLEKYLERLNSNIEA